MKHEQGLPIQLLVGILLTLGGLWHAAAPWAFGYSAVRAAVVSDVASGLALTLVGVGYVMLRRVGWLNMVAAAVALWILVAPQVLGVGRPWLAAVEASWTGLLTIALVIVASFDWACAGRITDHNRSVEAAA